MQRQTLTYKLRPAARITLLAICVGIISISCKRDRLLDSSTRERPAWVYGIEPNAVIVEASGRNHDEARDKAFRAVKESIVNAVAVNVSSTVQMEVSEQVMNDVRSFRENTEINTTVSSAFLSSLRGVHINKALDWYWELRRNPDKVRYVVYHIKYPFTENELMAYVNEWEALDTELNSALEELSARADQSRDLSELENMRREAERFAEIFMEPRRSMALNVASRIRQRLDNLRIEVVEHQRGELIVALRSNGSTMRAAHPPRFQSGCAQMEHVQFLEVEGHYLLQYDVSFCDKPAETLSLSLDVDGRERRSQFSIPDDPDHVSVKLSGWLHLQRLSGAVHEWQLPLRVLGRDSIEIGEVEVSLQRQTGRLLAALSRRGREGMNTTIRRQLNQECQGGGECLIRFEASRLTNEADEIFTSLFDASAVYTASGRFTYRKAGAEAWRDQRFEHLNVVLR